MPVAETIVSSPSSDFRYAYASHFTHDKEQAHPGHYHEVVEQCVWLYFRFAVSYRDIEEMMTKRGIKVTYETVREWCHKFGSLYAAQLRTKRARVEMKWHMDEVFLKMNGVQHYLWRAVDQNGAVIDILVQPRRDRWAALRFFFASCSIPHAEHRASSSRTSYGATLQQKE